MSLLDHDELEKHDFDYLGGEIWFDRTANDYYFSDETEQFQGPYSTEDEARESLRGYVAWLNGG